MTICNSWNKYIVNNYIQSRQVLLDVGHCSDVIRQFMFEPAHKCCISSACGSVFAIFDRTFSWSHYEFTSSSAYLPHLLLLPM